MRKEGLVELTSKVVPPAFNASTVAFTHVSMKTQIPFFQVQDCVLNEQRILTEEDEALGDDFRLYAKLYYTRKII